MPAEHEIRADFDRETIVVYQAYPPMIADAALMAQRFVAPFSMHRMTWIKPSFLWLMHRSNWGQKSGQERVLAVRITRDGWEKALSLAVPTGFEPSVFRTRQDWEETLQGRWSTCNGTQSGRCAGRGFPTQASRSVLAGTLSGTMLRIGSWASKTSRPECGESTPASRKGRWKSRSDTYRRNGCIPSVPRSGANC